METGLNPLERLREQRAQQLLVALQSDLRAQIRREDDEAGRRAHTDRPRNAQQELQRRIARLADPEQRMRYWTRAEGASFQGTAVNALPKTRAFWAAVDVTLWTKQQLDEACALLDLHAVGKKAELAARIQDWVHAPEIQAELEERKRLERQRDDVLISGRVFACGANFHGQLGLGDRLERRVPTEIERLRGECITTVASGFDASHAFALSSDGRMFAWGGGGKAVPEAAARHRLQRDQGRGPAVERNVEPDPFATVSTTLLKPSPSAPPREPHLQELGQQEQQEQHHDQGNAETVAADAPGCFLWPNLVSDTTDMRVASIACARTEGHVALVTQDGACFTWGRAEYGELGVEGDPRATAAVAALRPVHVRTLDGALSGTTTAVSPSRRALASSSSSASTRIKQISVGNCHTAALTDRGTLFVWGACWSGQLGLGVTKRMGIPGRRQQQYFPTPTPVEAFAGQRIVRVSCGAVHTGVITAEGRLFTFGCGDGGRLGLGSDTGDAISPALVTALERDTVVDVICGNWHSLCLVRRPQEDAALPSLEGYVYSFGNGLHGQLGLGKQKVAALPTRVPDLYHRRVSCRAITASSHHSCALSSDGQLYTWGQNTSGCLGRELVGQGAGVSLSGSSGHYSADPDVVSSSFLSFGVGPIVSIACGHGFTLFATGPWEPPPLEQDPRHHFTIHEKLNRLNRPALRS